MAELRCKGVADVFSIQTTPQGGRVYDVMERMVPTKRVSRIQESNVCEPRSIFFAACMHCRGVELCDDSFFAMFSKAMTSTGTFVFPVEVTPRACASGKPLR